MVSSEADLTAMIGRPLFETLPRPEFEVDGLTVVNATCRGDTTILYLSRPQTTLVPIPE